MDKIAINLNTINEELRTMLQYNPTIPILASMESIGKSLISITQQLKEEGRL